MKAAARLRLYGALKGEESQVPAIQESISEPQAASVVESVSDSLMPALKELPEFRPIAAGLLGRQIEIPLRQNIVPLPYDALQFPAAIMGMLDLAGPGLPPGDVLFLDTETTGLSIGPGTLPFLIGLAWWHEERITIRQLFLSSPGGESALVKELDAVFARFPYLCTFNGKSYDLPLIRNRFTLQRKTMKSFAHHFDLLHIWRRLLPRDFPGGFKQKNLETAILRSPRPDDIDGASIPEIYFDWIRYGVDHGLSKIIRHNELDMQGMIALYAEAAALFEQNRKTEKKKDQTPTLIRIGRILFRNHQDLEALDLLEPLLSQPIPLQEDRRILYTTLFRIYARLDRKIEAALCLERLVQSERSAGVMLLLLRFLEYRLQDFEWALRVIDEIPQIPVTGDLLQGKPLERRRSRIIKKLATRRTGQHHR